jgi:NAD-dependent deacetylase
MTVCKNPAALMALVEQADNIVALTGAGLSTAAGIPDFRGPEGLYVTRRYDPDMTFSLRGFERDPTYFYRFAADFIELLARIRPTFAHRFLARLEDAGKLSAVITQNIDMLHQAAGSSKVIELHGSFRSATCRACGKQDTGLDVPWWQRAIAAHSGPPVVLCPSCGGVIKPDIVFYGEPVENYGAAEAVVRGCDLLLVLGTSLTVTPAAYLPSAASAPVIAVSQGDVELASAEHDHIVNADLDEFCRTMAGVLKP